MSIPAHREAHSGESNDIPISDMALPFNPQDLARRARIRGGFSVAESRIFAHIAITQLRQEHENTQQPVTTLQIAKAIKEYARREVEKAENEGEETDNEKFESEGEEDDDGDEQEDEDEYEEVQEDGFENEEDSDDEEEDEEDDEVEYEENLVFEPIGAELEQHPPQPMGTEDVKLVEEVVDGMKQLKFSFSEEAKQRYFQGRDPYENPTPEAATNTQDDDQRDVLTTLCNNPVLAVELGKHLGPRDILNLFIACRSFNQVVTGYMLSSIRTWIAYLCPEAGRLFPFKLYKNLLIPDPQGRTWGDMGHNHPAPHQVRTVPGLKYLQLVLTRDRCCREIVAILARNGHRTPKTMYSTLLRLWLLLDLSTTAQRRALLRNAEIWRDDDLYNAQLFFIKLGMLFNDPVYGPTSYELLHLMMGQRGLYPLWQLLLRKRFTTLSEILELKALYDIQVPEDHWGHDFSGDNVHHVPFDSVGTFHLEGWGLGRAHLMRPDELVPFEAVTRGLGLEQHLPYMMLWGFFDWRTGENIVPTEEEIYISDEETALAHMDTTYHWKKKHALKKRWTSLSQREKQRIMDDDADDDLRALAWAAYEDEEDEEGDSEEDTDDSSGMSDETEKEVGYDGEGDEEDAEDEEELAEEVEEVEDIIEEEEDEEDAEGEEVEQEHHDEGVQEEGEGYDGYVKDDHDIGKGEEDEDKPYDPNDEITRGYIVPRLSEYGPSVPTVDDHQGWVNFVNQALIGMTPTINEDQALRAQAWQTYRNSEVDNDIDWAAWLRQEQGSADVNNADPTSANPSGMGTMWWV